MKSNDPIYDTVADVAFILDGLRIVADMVVWNKNLSREEKEAFQYLMPSALKLSKNALYQMMEQEFPREGIGKKPS